MKNTLPRPYKLHRRRVFSWTYKYGDSFFFPNGRTVTVTAYNPTDAMQQILLKVGIAPLDEDELDEHVS